MKVKDLIAILQLEDQEAVVIQMDYDGGDHCHRVITNIKNYPKDRPLSDLHFGSELRKGKFIMRRTPGNSFVEISWRE